MPIKIKYINGSEEQFSSFNYWKFTVVKMKNIKSIDSRENQDIKIF